MSFTQVTITGTWLNPDGSPANGTVCATLSESIENNETRALASAICGTLNSDGSLQSQLGEAFILAANDDVATTPTDSYYVFTIQLDGQDVYEFRAVVSHMNTTISIFDLEANKI